MSDPDDDFAPMSSDEEGEQIDDLHVFNEMVSALKKLDAEARMRLFRTLATFFEIPLQERAPKVHLSVPATSPEGTSFSEDRALSPKQFLFEKKPMTDVERVGCLAYYLTHYRNTPHFKTLDISKLNTEAAQVKFSNPAYAVDNATKAGLLVPAVKGQKQISSVGELYVQALPDREAARGAAERARRRRSRAKAKTTNEKPPPEEET
jgi:hypothetical protein